MTSRFAAAVADAVGEQPCIVALGGGADSAMLLHATIEAAPRGGVRAVFAFHGLASSSFLERAAKDLADDLDVGLTVVDATIVDGPSLEARARNARYRAIEADLTGGELGLTGHTADDQAETVLMRLMRGSGAGGLAGIPVRRGPWTRPFLAMRRAELRTEAQRLGLGFVDDPANEDARFLRSRIRHGLLPEIDKNYAPGITGSLTRTATLLDRDDQYLDSLSDGIAISRLHGNVTLPAPAIATAPGPVATRAIRRALRLCGDDYPGSMDDVDAVLNVARTGRAAVISGDIEVRCEPPLVVLITSGARPCDAPLDVSGESSFRWGQRSYNVTRRRYPVAQRTAGRFSVISASESAAGCYVRCMAPGDRIDTGSGSTPVTEVLRDHGVGRMRRSCWLMVTIDGKIAAVHGVRTAAWATPRNGDDVMIIEQEVRS